MLVAGAYDDALLCEQPAPCYRERYVMSGTFEGLSNQRAAPGSGRAAI